MSSSYHQLSADERKIIESCLSIDGITRKTIATQLGRDPKSISYEILHHRQVKVRTNQRNVCGRQNSCNKVRLCTDCLTGMCKFCRHKYCNNLCPDFTDINQCRRLKRFPFVCSGCSELAHCQMPKYFYFAETAQKEHCASVTDWKIGPSLSAPQMKTVANEIKDGVERNLSLDVIIHSKALPISLSTGYRYVTKHYIPDVINFDLKRKSRYKQRESSKPKIVRKNCDYLEGRTLEDFQKRVLEDPASNVWQMDTVVGKKGSHEKAALSLLYTRTNLQLYFLLDSKTSSEVTRVFAGILSFLGPELFKQTFAIIKTDNGIEFDDPLTLETDPYTGEQLINIYYCQPRRSDQKGKCEKNHEHFRECVPPGLSMNPMTRNDMRYVSRMVNNYPRRLLNYCSPLQASIPFLDEKVFKLNHLTEIAADHVKLVPLAKLTPRP